MLFHTNIGRVISGRVMRHSTTTTISKKNLPCLRTTTRHDRTRIVSFTRSPLSIQMSVSTIATTTPTSRNSMTTTTATAANIIGMTDTYHSSSTSSTATMSPMKAYHTGTTPKLADAVVTSANTSISSSSTTTSDKDHMISTSNTVMIWNRWTVTVEAAISKIFPGGFGWQTGSIVAANYCHYSSDSVNFALCTGLGDAVGVFVGHCLYYYVKQSLSLSTTSPVDMTKETHTGLWLGTAAFCSGTVWQPVVTLLQSSNCTFTQVMVGTWLTCSTAFYIGLRGGRTLLPLSTLSKPTYDNSQTDLALSISIGGATGFFVGTDTAYLPDQNFLLPLVGITATTTDFVGCTLAGTSTALGFVTAQSVLNSIYPYKKCWND
jgi:VIT1/CCC1 family predicted Fe2+/Mn2+ transporter